jgi:lipopolysaccharide exporter
MERTTSEVGAVEADTRETSPSHSSIGDLLTPRDTLSRRAIRSGFWVLAVRVGDQLLRLARTVFLARLLAPEDFGLFGIALLSLSILDVFSQTGFQAALIQRKDDIGPYLDTSWTIQAIRGAALALVLFGIAPYVAEFFATPAAAALVRVLGLSAALQGLVNIAVVYFQKELQFHKQFIYQLSGTLVDLIVSVAVALVLRNAWALMFGLLAGTLTRTLVSYLIHPFRPRPALAPTRARELYAFGKWILVNSILFFAATQGDRVFVGKVLGATALGLYGLASQISNMPTTEITNVVSQVAFPAYSKLQDDLKRMRRAYLKVLQVTVLGAAPLGGWLFILAGDLTRLFLGDAWMPMVPAVRVLALAGLVRAVLATPGPMFKGLGRPELQTKGQAMRLCILAVSICPFALLWGLVGVAASLLVSNFLSAVWFSWKAVAISGSGIERFGRAIMPALAGAVVLVCVIHTVRGAIGSTHLLAFGILTGLGAVSYLGTIVILDRYSNYSLRSLTQEWWAAARSL